MRNLSRRGAGSAIVRDYAFPFRGDLPGLDSWIRSHFIYRDELEEILRTPEFMLRTMEVSGYFDGDCDDASILYASMLLALGYPARFVAIRYDASPEFKHVFVEVKDGGGWVAVDPTVAPGTPYVEVERMVLDV